MKFPSTYLLDLSFLINNFNPVCILPILVANSVGNLQLSNQAVFLVDGLRANAALPVAPYAVRDGHLVDVLAVLAAPLGVVVANDLGDCRHFYSRESTLFSLDM